MIYHKLNKLLKQYYKVLEGRDVFWGDSMHGNDLTCLIDHIKTQGVYLYITTLHDNDVVRYEACFGQPGTDEETEEEGIWVLGEATHIDLQIAIAKAALGIYGVNV